MARRLLVYHAYFGCDTGCCGHTVELLNGDEKRGQGHEKFEFASPDDGESDLDFAKRLVRESFGEDHVADLDWDNCHIVDCSTCL